MVLASRVPLGRCRSCLCDLIESIRQRHHIRCHRMYQLCPPKGITHHQHQLGKQGALGSPEQRHQSPVKPIPSSWPPPATNDAIKRFDPIAFANFGHILSLTTATNHDTLASYSNHGAASVDLTAPAGAILSTEANGDHSYNVNRGTSMSTPLASGAVAPIFPRRRRLRLSPAFWRPSIRSPVSGAGASQKAASIFPSPWERI
ncbi:MAG: hypothetical protein M2R45_04208 [Verrucomicrobia subdivision 3 bacterium]|nr:hypothetical protein [Limisphaerales bacterium]MCS1417055.1 hypothetical protein [Limisphaerales bacterium]